MLMPDQVGPLDDAGIDAAYTWPAQPWVRANMVSTVDGGAQSSEGTSRGISSDADRRVFSALRGSADVVLVGAQTVRVEGYRPARPKVAYADDRAARGQLPAPVIAVVSRSLNLPLDSPLFAVRRAQSGGDATPPIIITTADADATRRAAIPSDIDVLAYGVGDVDLGAAIAELHRRGFARIHCEGGPHLLSDLIGAGLLDELCLTISPMLMGSTPGDIVGRITAPSSRPHGALDLTLGHLLEGDGSLFARYLVTRGVTS
jgi:riboflavin biosynthesis pyrimidine reductase